MLEQVTIVAPTYSTALPIGKTGISKEVIAHAIHNLSSRRDHTFVRLHCAAIPHGLMESELFGHEKGAFTGALLQKRGRIELAREGSFFLDETGDIDPELQPKLLRVPKETEFERLGSNRTVKVEIVSFPSRPAVPRYPDVCARQGMSRWRAWLRSSTCVGRSSFTLKESSNGLPLKMYSDLLQPNVLETRIASDPLHVAQKQYRPWMQSPPAATTGSWPSLSSIVIPKRRLAGRSISALP